MEIHVSTILAKMVERAYPRKQILTSVNVIQSMLGKIAHNSKVGNFLTLLSLFSLP